VKNAVKIHASHVFFNTNPDTKITQKYY